MSNVFAINGRHPNDGLVRPPYNDHEQHHDCLWCHTYVNTECARCGELIMSTIPGNDGMNCMLDICYQCELTLIDEGTARD